MKSLPGMLGMDDFVPFDELTDEKDLIVDNWVRVYCMDGKKTVTTKVCAYRCLRIR